MNGDSSNDIEKNNLPNPSAQEWHPSFNPWLITISVMCATFMEVLDTSVANVSLPHIAGSLSASTDEATWVLTSYLISNAIILPSTNWLSSFFGRKQLLMGCIAIFTLSSALCGAATSLGMLIAARVMQGVGGGVLQPIAQAVLLESFPLEKRGQAMAIYGMGIIVAPIVGPTLGGWITDNYSWRWIFYINVPVGIATVFMVQSFIENPPYLQRGSKHTVDYVGFGLMALWLSTLQIVLDKGQEEDWFASAWITQLAVISAIALILFVIQELRTENPIVDMCVFKNRNFRVGALLIMAVGAVLYRYDHRIAAVLANLTGLSRAPERSRCKPKRIRLDALHDNSGTASGKNQQSFLDVLRVRIACLLSLRLERTDFRNRQDQCYMAQRNQWVFNGVYLRTSDHDHNGVLEKRADWKCDRGLFIDAEYRRQCRNFRRNYDAVPRGSISSSRACQSPRAVRSDVSRQAGPNSRVACQVIRSALRRSTGLWRYLWNPAKAGYALGLYG